MVSSGVYSTMSGPARRGLAVLAIWTATIAMIAAAGGSVLEVAIFTTGAAACYTAYTNFGGASFFRGPGQSGANRCTDPRTGLTAPDCAEHFLQKEFAAAERGRQVTLVMFGFDAYDSFASTHGRSAADDAVNEFGTILKRLTRRMNLSARSGWRSDTFLSVLSGSDEAGARIYVERVRAAAAQAATTLPMPTVSAGIAEFDARLESPEEFLALVERALAEARSAGGNCVRVGKPSGAGSAAIRLLQAR